MPIVKKCKYCNKEFISNRNKVYCNRKCSGNFFYHNNPYRKEKAKLYNRKNYTKNFKYKQKVLKIWFIKNRKRQNKNILNNYYKNKLIWFERRFTSRYRKIIIKLINKKCLICNNKVNIIHHKKYCKNYPRLNKINKEQRHNALKKYCRNLIGFCSKECHRKYERRICK